MSIIHDALKKVQSKGPNTAPDILPPERNPAATVAAEPAHETTNRSLTILMATVLTVAVIVIFAVILKLAFETTQHPDATARAITPVPTKATAVQPAAAPVPPPSAAQAAIPATQLQPPAETHSPEGTHVEGVMDMGGKMVALINGNVYEEGQVVDGNIIAAITFESVTIMENGTKKILPIKR